MTEPQWRPIDGQPGYFVSDRGDVMSTKRGKPKLLRASPIERYPHVYLMQNGAKRTVAVHRLVAAAFIGPRPPGCEVRHLDGIRWNNTVGNLCYGTKAQNTLDAVAHGTHPQARKTRCPQGHPYDEANTARDRRSGGRICRICKRETARRYRIRRALRAAGYRDDKRANQRIHYTTETGR